MILVHSRRAALALLFVACSVGASLAQAQTDPLPSWNDGTVKKSITDFVARVVTQGAPSSYRLPNGSPPSTTTVRYGPSSRSISNFSSRSTALTRWRRNIRNGKLRSRSRRYLKRT